MDKKELKRKLKKEHWLLDTHRLTPKSEGGEYVALNVDVLRPVEHMDVHGTLRERDGALETIKSIVDDRQQVMKLKNKVNNQLLALKRGTDILNKKTVEYLTEKLKEFESELRQRGKILAEAMEEFRKVDRLSDVALRLKGIGPVTIAYCRVYIDIEKARHASSLWAYAGLDKPSHDRYKKGKAGGGNKTLRTMLYTMADSQIKSRGPYREVYDRVKERLSNSDKITKSRNTQGNLIECAWKDTKPSHRHGAAIRAVIKHFLADYWYVAREINGLDTTPLYAESQLGKHKTIMPKERGWEY